MRLSAPQGKAAPTSVTLPMALQLLKFPRLLGSHPDDGAPVVANIGRFGPYVQHAELNASLGKRASADDVTLETALQVGDGTSQHSLLMTKWSGLNATSGCKIAHKV